MDLISRQDAIIHFVKASKNYECGMFSLAEVTHELWEIPSAERKGKWSIEDCHASTYKYCCSECKAHHRAMYDYCPSCGADMRGEEDV